MKITVNVSNLGTVKIGKSSMRVAAFVAALNQAKLKYTVGKAGAAIHVKVPDGKSISDFIDANNAD